MSGLPAFPEIADTQGGRVVDGVDYGFDLDAATIAILSARAEAYAARLRVAVDAIRYARVNAGAENLRHKCVMRLDAALAAIGELP